MMHLVCPMLGILNIILVGNMFILSLALVLGIILSPLFAYLPRHGHIDLIV
jgi:hypothetical protein